MSIVDLVAVLRIPGIDFQVPSEIVMLGLLTGLTYGLLAVGLTLIYKTTRVINFAHGEVGALPAVIIPILVLGHGWSYWAALPLALLAAVCAGAATEFLVIRRLERSPRLIVLVATVGVSQLLFLANLLIPRHGALGNGAYPTPVSWRFSVGNLRLTPGHVLILIVAPLAAAAVTLFLNRTRLGLASRAVAENSDCASLLGVPVHRVASTVWIVAALLAATSAILVGPTQPLQAQAAVGPSLMVRALAAALLGGLSSLPRVFLGGVAIGVVELLVLWNYPTGGLLELILLVIVIGSLAIYRDLGRGARGGEGSSWALAGAIRTLPPRLARMPQVVWARRGFMIALIAIAALAPLGLPNSQQVLLSSVVIFAIMGLSLVILTGFAGQVSLGQFTFVGLGALVGSKLVSLGYPPWIAMLYAGLASAGAALVIGIPALRVRGLFLAVATLSFALASQRWLFSQPWLRPQRGFVFTSVGLPRFRWGGIDFSRERNYYWLCLAMLVVVSAFVARLRSSGIGRAMIAVRDNEPHAATLSLSPRHVKLLAFVLSGFIAGIAGYLFGNLLVSFNPNTSFGPEQSIALVTMAIFGGITTVTGAVLGAAWVRGIPYLLGANWGLLSSGLGLVVVLLLLPSGLAGLAFRIRDWVVTRLTSEPIDEVSASDRQQGVARTPLPPRPEPRTPIAGADGPVPALEAREVTVSFGGNVALRGASIHAAPGEIVGLVGPNGAGKTTLFDILSGQLRPDHGHVLLHGYDITRLRPEQRARAGLGRSFQQARLFDQLSLVDALKVALEREEPSETVPSLLGLPPARLAEWRKEVRAEELVELLGLGPFSRRSVAELSTGTRRVAELGCIIALGADVILLDEPMAGIAQREVEAFVPVLREVRDHLDATVLVIDHDLPMLSSLADRMYVLAAGEVIAEGSPSDVRHDPLVVAAYLGTDERTIGRSGTAPAKPRRRTPLRAGTP